MLRSVPPVYRPSFHRNHQIILLGDGGNVVRELLDLSRGFFLQRRSGWRVTRVNVNNTSPMPSNHIICFSSLHS